MLCVSHEKSRRVLLYRDVMEPLSIKPTYAQDLIPCKAIIVKDIILKPGMGIALLMYLALWSMERKKWRRRKMDENCANFAAHSEAP